MEKNSFFIGKETKNKEMTYTEKLSPLVGESVSGADERGKCEQTCEMIRTCVRKLAPIASQARHFPAKGEASHCVFASLCS